VAGPITSDAAALRAVRTEHKESAEMRLVRAFMAAALVVMAIAPTAVLAQGLTMVTAFPAVVRVPRLARSRPLPTRTLPARSRASSQSR
jgi:hypothetical protein